MTFTTILLVAAGAAVGAPLRFVLTRAVVSQFPAYLSMGTLVINVMGSLILGFVVGVGAAQLVLAVGIGFCGALTTFSGFSLEVADLTMSRRHRMALATVVLSLVICVAAAALGLLLGRAIG